MTLLPAGHDLKRQRQRQRTDCPGASPARLGYLIEYSPGLAFRWLRPRSKLFRTLISAGYAVAVVEIVYLETDLVANGNCFGAQAAERDIEQRPPGGRLARRRRVAYRRAMWCGATSCGVGSSAAASMQESESCRSE